MNDDAYSAFMKENVAPKSEASENEKHRDAVSMSDETRKAIEAVMADPYGTFALAESNWKQLSELQAQTKAMQEQLERQKADSKVWREQLQQQKANSKVLKEQLEQQKADSLQSSKDAARSFKISVASFIAAAGSLIIAFTQHPAAMLLKEWLLSVLHIQ